MSIVIFLDERPISTDIGVSSPVVFLGNRSGEMLKLKTLGFSVAVAGQL